MHWFKHLTSYRDNPAMKMIFRVCGLEGVAIAYRLMEVGAANCKEETAFSSTLVLEPPLTKDMLAVELLTELDDEGYGARMPKADDIEPYLDTFTVAGLIERGSVTEPGSTKVNGKRVPADVTFETIRFVGLEDLMDDYTERCKRKAEMRRNQTSKKK